MNTSCVKCKSQHKNKCVSHPLTECSLLPFLNPCCNLIQIFLHVIRCVAWQLMYNIWFIGSLCFLQYCLKYFTLHIVFQFLACVASVTRSWKPCFSSSITMLITSSHNICTRTFQSTRKKTAWHGHPLQLAQIFIIWFNPLNAELNAICYLLALLGAHHFLHVSRIRVKSLTLWPLMSYIYGAPILDVSRSHTMMHHSR